MTDERRFAGRVALVTGASRGIGAATAKALAAGVAGDLAELGRAVMREHYQHGWSSYDNEVSVRSGDEMLRLALNEPDRAAARWQRLLDTDGGKHVAQAA